MNIEVSGIFFSKRTRLKKNSALGVRLLPFIVLLASFSATLIIVLRNFDIDKIGLIAILYVLAIASACSIVISYSVITALSDSNNIDAESPHYFPVSWKTFELMAFTPIAILAVAGVFRFFAEL